MLTLISTPFTIVVYLALAAALVAGYLLRRRTVREIQPSAEARELNESRTPQP